LVALAGIIILMGQTGTGHEKTTFYIQTS
jgi:hypothetical protein